VTREKAIERQAAFDRRAAPLSADELWLSLMAKQSRLYERLTSRVKDLKPKKRLRLEQELHELRVVLALMLKFFPEIRKTLESE
jgi:hypothetical protein